MAGNPLAPKDHHEYSLALKLQELRAAAGKTQKQVAQEAGIDESTVRNYELARRTPAPEHLPGLARALEVMPGALVAYDFENIGTAAELYALIQLSDNYGLKPKSDGDEVWIAPSSDFMATTIERWIIAYGKLCINEDVERSNYERWKSNFHEAFDKADFPSIYPNYDPVKADSSARWETDKFAAKLKKLRGIHGMTQDALAEASGLSKFTIRSYEQGKRLPREKQLAALAEAFEINDAALSFWFFGDPNQAAHALFKLCTQYRIYPETRNGRAALNVSDTFFGYGILRWAEEKAALVEAGKSEAATHEYWVWLDGFDPDSDEVIHEARERGLCAPKLDDYEEPRA